MQKEKIKIGDSASVSKTITETDVYCFAEICGDFNPLHVNEKEAEKSRFGKRICHGMLVSSFISTVLGMYLPGPGSIYLEQSLEFLAPVFIDDTITVTVIVKEINNKIVSLETIVVNQNMQKVIKGYAKVMV
ncbi:MAG: MaoC family dehydratase [Lachnospiraceae bacterium]|nr:MaoC family dehydratase [Lachnospiraceae bacterium]